MLLFLVQLVFVLLALGLVVGAFYPIPGWPWTRQPMPWAVLWLILELLVLWLLYLLITVLFLGAPAPNLGR